MPEHKSDVLLIRLNFTVERDPRCVRKDLGVVENLGADGAVGLELKHR